MKKLLLTVLFLLLWLSPVHAYLEWYANLDANTGTTVTPDVGVQTCAFTNSPTWTTGKFNYGIDFDSGTTDYLDCGSAHIISTNDWAFAAWIKPEASALYRVILHNGDNSGANRSGNILEITNVDKLQCQAWTGANQVTAITSTASIDETGLVWTHVGCKKVGTALTLWINGSQVTSGVLSSATMDYTGTAPKFFIGAQSNVTSPFLGQIDEPRAYNADVDMAAVYVIDASTPPSVTNYYVATTGLDTNPGTIGSPFLTVQKCATVAVSGDTCYVSTGTYRETVTPTNSGVIFSNYNNEVVTISGADIVTGWSLYSGSIYRSSGMTWTLGAQMDQIFVDGQMMNWARWPNSSLDVSAPTYAIAGTGSVGATDSTLNHSSLNQANGFWNGATIIHLGYVGWWTIRRTITNYTTGTLTWVTGTPDTDLYKPQTTGTRYYLLGGLTSLDAAGEWYRDGSFAYLWTPDGTDPSGHTIEIKHRQWAFDLSNRTGTVIQGIKIFAAGILSNGSTSDTVIDGTTAQYVAHTHTDDYRDNSPTSTRTEGGIILAGNNNEIKNCRITYSAIFAVALLDTNNKVTNCIIKDIAYAAAIFGGVYVEGSGHEITQNTIRSSGHAGINHIYASGIKIKNNHIYDVSLQVQDNGATYGYGTTNVAQTEIAYNLIHDVKTVPYHIRLSMGIYLDLDATNFLVHHNVVYNIGDANATNGWGIRLTSANNQAYNNTVWNAKTFAINSNCPSNCNVWNNLANNVMQGTNLQNNLQTTSDMFVSPGSGNFQLRDAVTAIDYGRVITGITDGFVGAAPDAGAYEYGATAWAAGSTLDVTPEPPPDLSTGYPADSWDGIHQFSVFGTPTYNVGLDTTKFDYEWSVGAPGVEGAWWTAKNTGNWLTGYYKDSIQSPLSLAQLQSLHPSWILYECDRTTPMTQYEYQGVMLDISNTDVLDYMLSLIGEGGAPKTATSWDNFNITNLISNFYGGWHYASACGVYSSPGVWVQKFNGNGNQDRSWTDAVIASAAYVKAALAARTPYPVALIPNLSGLNYLLGDSVRLQQLANAVDGILDEQQLLTKYHLSHGTEVWVNNLNFIAMMQAAGKGVYSLTTATTNAERQFNVAAYLLAKGRSAALWIGPDINYSSFPILTELTSADVGTPCDAAMYQTNGAGQDGVWMRKHTKGVSVVNSSTTQTFDVTLPSGTFLDLYGNSVTSPVSMGPETGLVLISAATICGGTTTHVITINSSFASSCAIAVTPTDLGLGNNGITSFIRTYVENTAIALTAAATCGGLDFEKWQKDGVDFTSSPQANLTVDAAYTMTATYVTPPPTTHTITVNSATPTDARISCLPADNNGVTTGTAPFVLTYNIGTSVVCKARVTAYAPLAWYQLENDALDSSNNGLDGTLINSPTFVTGDGSGYALSFDAASLQNVRVADSPLFANLTAFTIALRANPASALTSFKSGAVKNYGFGLYVSSTDYCAVGAPLVFFQHANGTVYTACDPTPLPALAWTRLRGTCSGTSLAIMRNGSVIGTPTTVPSCAVANSTGVLQLGASQYAGEYLPGAIDDARFYDLLVDSDDNPGDAFTSWASCDSATTYSCTVAASSDKTITATFGASAAGLAQTAWKIYDLGMNGSVVVDISPIAKIVKGGSFSVALQVDATGADPPTTTLLRYYNKDGGAYGALTDTCAAPDYVCFHGAADARISTPPSGSIAATCLSGALTAFAGTTARTAAGTPSFDISQDACIVNRSLVHFGTSAAGLYCFRDYRLDGTPLDSYTSTPCVTVTDYNSSGM